MNTILELQKLETESNEGSNKDWSTISNTCNNG
jgi:hypothetical protein